MALTTPMTELFKIKHPVMLAGMAGAAGPELAAAVSNAGGLGNIGGVGFTPAALRKTIGLLKKDLVDKNAPFGVDLLLPQVGGGARKTNKDYTAGALPELVDIIIEEKAFYAWIQAALFICAVGVPPKWAVDKFHSAGIPVMNMIGAVKHVGKALEAGVDLICAQGGEGGGHTGDTATAILLPKVADAVRGKMSPLTGRPVQVVGAGGIFDGRGLAACLAMGCSGVWVGTRFIASDEAGAGPLHKQKILSGDYSETVRTTIYTGRPMRVVHLTGGISGLVGTTILGARTGRFSNPEEFECHNLPLVVLGTFALWFGWYGFNPGSTLTMKSGSDGALAAQVAMNTTLAAATGGITVFLLRYVITHKYDVGALCNGILAGLVSITAGCGNMESGSAVATGLIGGFVYQAASMLLQKLRIDDPVDASPVHGFCGAWGLIAAGLFDWGRGIDHYHGWSGFGCMEKDDGGCQTGIGGTAIGVQFIMVLAIVAWAGTLSGIGFFLLKVTGALRYGTHVEEVGIDSHHHSPPKAYALGPNSLSPSKVYDTMTSESERSTV